MNEIGVEVNIDGIVGPTHHYGGLSYGNVASMRHYSAVSNPRQAALQGLEKMHFMMQLGIPQLVLPPQLRPNFHTLHAVGFNGTESDILEKAFQYAPDLLSASYSSSSMWTANTATVCPSFDSMDQTVHFTPANLISNFHRSIEVSRSARVLRSIFPKDKCFTHHSPLPSSTLFSDEGAANHTRLSATYASQGIHLFVYGGDFRRDDKRIVDQPRHFPARQSLHASQAVARLHQIPPECVLFAKQNPRAIDAGVFHNDVISVGNLNFFLYHESAFAEGERVIDQLRLLADRAGFDLLTHCVKEEEVSLKDAVKSYLFNSQLVSLSENVMALIAPEECRLIPSVQKAIDRILEGENPVQMAYFSNLRQSMRNGGGPACLRLRLVLAKNELAKVHEGVKLTESLYDNLRKWVNRHYREKLVFNDLKDPELVVEAREAQEELLGLLNLAT